MIDWLAFQLLMHGPWRIVCSADNWLGRWCLRGAGAYAYGRNPHHNGDSK